MTNIDLKKYVYILLGASILLGATPVVSAEWHNNSDVVIRHDDNTNNAQMRQDFASTTSLHAGISATGHFPLEDGNSLSLTGETELESFDRYSGLNNLSLGATLAFRKKWGLGPYAPRTGLSLSSAHLNYSNNIRNGWRHQIAIQGGERFSERWNVRAEYMYERRTANTQAPDQPGISGDVFSQKSKTMTLNTEYAKDENIFLTGGILLRRGDVVATASETANLIASSDAIAEDPVFGGAHFYAYRLQGTTRGLDLGVNFVLTSSSLLRASISRQITHAAGDNNYAKTMQMVSWNYNF